MTDPHRHACGCINAIDPPTGVLRSVEKCRAHRAESRDPAALGEDYYTSLGVIRGGRLLPTAHVAELAEALGPLPRAPADGGALEVGCGASPYVGMIRAAGYRYTGLDASPWAARWTAAAYNVVAKAGAVESLPSWPRYDLILAAHVLEHLHDLPGAVVRLAGLLRPGGELWVVVPDDSDPVNPDHLWFATGATLRGCLESAGLAVVTLAVRRYVPQENFLYARARKPAQ